MAKSLLLCTDGSEYSHTAADYAILLAQGLGARVEALHVIDARLMGGPYLADIGGVLGAQPYEAFLPQMQELQQEKAALVLDMLRKKFSEKSMELSADVRTGSLVGTILEHETRCDLVILGKRGEHARYGDDVIGSSVEWIVRKSVKPCFVCPAQFRPLQRVVAAFDGSSHAEKALMGALDLVLALKLPLAIVTVEPNASSTALWRGILKDGVLMAKQRGVEATEMLMLGNPEEKILEYCRTHEADLLVMGAYGHTRIREFLLGSTTFHILLKSDIPLYMIR